MIANSVPVNSDGFGSEGTGRLALVELRNVYRKTGEGAVYRHRKAGLENISDEIIDLRPARWHNNQTF